MMNTEIYFQDWKKATSTKSFLILGTLLRITIGLLFIWSAYSKLTAPNDWSAMMYLKNASGPFADFFRSLSGNSFVDIANVYGQLLIGLGFLFGALLKPAAFFASILMFLYYISNFEKNISHGFIDEHVVYMVLFATLCVSGFGRVAGLDYWFHKFTTKKNFFFAEKLF